jgi:hypothetical protein
MGEKDRDAIELTRETIAGMLGAAQAGPTEE